jgi:hypothetical protein
VDKAVGILEQLVGSFSFRAPPGADLGLRPYSEVRLVNGVPYIYDDTTRNFELAGSEHPVRKTPGSPWGKWLTAYKESPEEVAGWAVRIPHGAAPLQQRYRRVYEELRRRYAAARPGRSAEEKVAELHELARAAGHEFRGSVMVATQRAANAFMRHERADVFPKHDSGGWPRFEFYNAILRWQVGGRRIPGDIVMTNFTFHPRAEM